MMYAWVYARKISGSYVLQPGLMNRKKLFKNNFQYGLRIDGQRIEDAHRYLPEFEDHLLKLLKEIFDTKTTFDQTDDLKRCEYCAFRGICSR
ncbi:MAG: PD-(D/E)XK nuclease family protein [Cytophagales bacterium]